MYKYDVSVFASNMEDGWFNPQSKNCLFVCLFDGA